MRRKNIAVLFDCENINATFVKKILNELRSFGDIIQKQSFKNWSNDKCQAWDKKLHDEYGIEAIHVDTRTGKNSVDVVIVRTAMEIIFKKNVDIIAFITSDSDFKDIAITTKKYGIEAIGFGEKKTPDCLRNVYTKFIELPTKSDVTCDFFMNQHIKNMQIKELKEAISYTKKEAGHSFVCEVIVYLKKKYPDCSPKMFGESKWISVFKKFTDLFAFGYLNNKKAQPIVSLKN